MSELTYDELRLLRAYRATNQADHPIETSEDEARTVTLASLTRQVKAPEILAMADRLARAEVAIAERDAEIARLHLLIAQKAGDATKHCLASGTETELGARTENVVGSYLTAQELSSLIGCQPNSFSCMRRWLDRGKWPYAVIPRVARTYHDARMAGVLIGQAQTPQRVEPNFAALFKTEKGFGKKGAA